MSETIEVVSKCIRPNFRTILLWVIGGPCFLFSQVFCYAQSKSERIQLGIFTMAGNSLGINNASSPINNQVVTYRDGFVGTGLYVFIKLKKDSTASVLRYMKVDLGFASRSGAFDVGSGNIVRSTSNSFDLTVLLPVSYKVTAEFDGYAAFGAVISYQFNRTINPVQSLPNFSTENAFKPGYAVELGFRSNSGSAFGYRTMAQFNDYPYRVGAIFFAFCPTQPKKRKAK